MDYIYNAILLPKLLQIDRWYSQYQKIPKYKDLPVTLLGRLAIDEKFQGQKLGRLLLIDALKRSLDTSKSVASLAVIVDPLDQEASDFYFKYGFILLPDSGRMFLPMATIEQLFI